MDKGKVKKKTKTKTQQLWLNLTFKVITDGFKRGNCGGTAYNSRRSRTYFVESKGRKHFKKRMALCAERLNNLRANK